jgi:hypothetical protein
MGNIEMDLGVIGWGGMDWIYLAWDIYKWWASVMNFQFA